MVQFWGLAVQHLLAERLLLYSRTPNKLLFNVLQLSWISHVYVVVNSLVWDSWLLLLPLPRGLVWRGQQEGGSCLAGICCVWGDDRCQRS